MFGYIITNAETLPEDRQARFRSFYCGLCRTLRRRYGLKGSATLSYDLTFLAVLLNALYEPEETAGRERCHPHPLKAHEYVISEVMDYAAAMNLALAYHKLRDNWADDRSVGSLSASRMLRTAYERVARAYPGPCEAIEQWLQDIHDMEAREESRVDLPMNATGRMLGRLFVWREGDMWAELLSEVGDGLGRFIYLMDAWEDLPEDLKRGRYNPLKGAGDRADLDDFIQSALMLPIADATSAFEQLPILLDQDILRNILYSGVWTKFAMIRKKRESKTEEKEHAGSI